MTITGIVIGASQQVTVSPGDILEAALSFVYTTAEQANVELWMSLYIAPGRDYTIKESITLQPGTSITWEGSISMPISDNVGLRNKVYDLLIEIPESNLQASEENAIIVTGMTETTIGGIAELVGAMVMMMVMMMIMNIMQDPEGIMSGTKKYIEKGKEIAQPVIQIFTSGGESEE